MATSENVGLFPVCYEITTGLPGAPRFTVNLLVNTPRKTVTGYGVITQTTNPPLNVETKLDGDFSYMTVMGKEPNILVVLTGHFPLRWPPNAGVGPVILPNVQLRMVLANNWQSGTANYEYRTESLPSNLTPWHEVSNVPVKAVACFVDAAASGK